MSACLQVPGLVEKRPNLIIGDVVYLRQASPSESHVCLANIVSLAIYISCKRIYACAQKHCICAPAHCSCCVHDVDAAKPQTT